MAAAAATSATAPSAHRAGRAARRFHSIAVRGEYGQLNRVLGARAFRARDWRALIEDDVFVVFVAIVADVFVDRHFPSPRLVKEWQNVKPIGSEQHRALRQHQTNSTRTSSEKRAERTYRPEQRCCPISKRATIRWQFRLNHGSQRSTRQP